MAWQVRTATPRRGFVLALALLLPQVSSAAVPLDPEPLEEVVVGATRDRLLRLREELVLLEDRFYERFNELNSVDDFDVHCHLEARVGTRLKRRYCRAVYEDKALAAEAQDYYLFLARSAPPPVIDPAMAGSNPPTGTVWGGPPPPAFMVIEARKGDFRKNMLQVTGAHAELVDILRERAAVATQYETTRRQIFGRDALAGEKAPDGNATGP